MNISGEVPWQISSWYVARIAMTWDCIMLSFGNFLPSLQQDTPLCNAHTTGTDVLWAGCPILTLPLERMATRVAASLLIAAGLGDMVVSSMQEYEEKAVYLGNNPTALESIKERLKKARTRCPLFDTER